MVQPVCTTEIGRLAIKYGELQKMGVKLATLSCDKVQAGVCCATVEAFTMPQLADQLGRCRSQTTRSGWMMWSLTVRTRCVLLALLALAWQRVSYDGMRSPC